MQFEQRLPGIWELSPAWRVSGHARSQLAVVRTFRCEGVYSLRLRKGGNSSTLPLATVIAGAGEATFLRSGDGTYAVEFVLRRQVHDVKKNPARWVLLLICLENEVDRGRAADGGMACNQS